MILDLSGNIRSLANNELQKIIHKAFVDVILTESKKEGENLNRLTNKAVYLLCWLKRYMVQLFANWKPSDIGCFIYMGGCKSENEALFMSFLGETSGRCLNLVSELKYKMLMLTGSVII